MYLCIYVCLFVCFLHFLKHHRHYKLNSILNCVMLPELYTCIFRYLFSFNLFYTVDMSPSKILMTTINSGSFASVRI